MNKQAKKVQILGEEDLVKRALTNPDAASALTQYHAMVKAGKTPQIKYSELGGFRVFDTAA